MSGDEDEILVSEKEMVDWGISCLEAAGAHREHAAKQVKVLLSADRRGHYSHGFNRLNLYVDDIKNGLCFPNSAPVVEKETLAAALVDGQDGLGAVIGEFCVDLAVEKARQCGVAWVTAKRSNHFGIAGHYSARAAEQGMVGMAFTNGSPWVTATRAKGSRVLSTNPLSLAAPGCEGDGFLLDMATSAVAMGKLEVAQVRGEQIPEGWAVDGQGQMTRDPELAMREGAGLPLGGAESTGGYKGYGLAMMVEVLCGVMTGDTWGPNIRQWPNTEGKADLSHCFLVLDPTVCGQGFQTRIQEMLQTSRNLEPVCASKPVLAPGDPERQNEAQVEREGGIRYGIRQWDKMMQVSNALGQQQPKHKKL